MYDYPLVDESMWKSWMFLTNIQPSATDLISIPTLAVCMITTFSLGLLDLSLWPGSAAPHSILLMMLRPFPPDATGGSGLAVRRKKVLCSCQNIFVLNCLLRWLIEIGTVWIWTICAMVWHWWKVYKHIQAGRAFFIFVDHIFTWLKFFCSAWCQWWT